MSFEFVFCCYHRHYHLFQSVWETVLKKFINESVVMSEAKNVGFRLDYCCCAVFRVCEHQ